MNQQRPPVTGAARGLRLGAAALEAGGASLAAHLRPGSRDEWQAGRVMLKALLQLRGAALKVAQFLSMEADWLPPDAAQDFARACQRVPPMSAAFARDTVCAELGSIESRFASFDPEALAAASLGQVHAAVTRAGRRVVVKIQYPGMREAIRSDMSLLRRAGGLLGSRALDPSLLGEIESRLLEECDYELEFRTLAWFGERLRVEGVSVPEPIVGLCGPSVLTIERMPGRHLDDWLAGAPSRRAREQAAQRLYDVFIASMWELGRLHADPNPGNVLFQDDGRISLIDFGCTRWIAEDCQRIVQRIFRSALAHDDEAAHAVYLDMGLFKGLSESQARDLDRRCMKPFRDWLAVPFMTERYDFGADPDFIPLGRTLFMRSFNGEALVGVRPEFVLVNRTLYGLYRLFERLGARVRCQAAWVSP